MTIKHLAFGILMPFLVSCATITVNVYFPDKDVEAAYEDIEKSLDFDMAPARKDTATVSPRKSRSGLFFGATSAWAEGKINIKQHLNKMSDVQESLERRESRLDRLGALLDARWVGLRKDGLIAAVPAGLAPEDAPEDARKSIGEIFGETSPDTLFREFLAAENADREILIRGMAVATLRATEQDDQDAETLRDAIDKSRALFVKSRIAKLNPGWFFQDEKGKWRQVEPEKPEKDGPPAGK